MVGNSVISAALWQVNHASHMKTWLYH